MAGFHLSLRHEMLNVEHKSPMKIVNAGLRVLALLDKLASVAALTPGYKLAPLESDNAMKTKDSLAGVAALDSIGKAGIKKSMHKTNLWTSIVRLTFLRDVNVSY